MTTAALFTLAAALGLALAALINTIRTLRAADALIASQRGLIGTQRRERRHLERQLADQQQRIDALVEEVTEGDQIIAKLHGMTMRQAFWYAHFNQPTMPAPTVLGSKRTISAN